jgi:hypothetical protein
MTPGAEPTTSYDHCQQQRRPPLLQQPLLPLLLLSSLSQGLHLLQRPLLLC